MSFGDSIFLQKKKKKDIHPTPSLSHGCSGQLHAPDDRAVREKTYSVRLNKKAFLDLIRKRFEVSTSGSFEGHPNRNLRPVCRLSALKPGRFGKLEGHMVSFTVSGDGVSRHKSGAGRAGKWAEITVPMALKQRKIRDLAALSCSGHPMLDGRRKRPKVSKIWLFEGIGTVISDHFPERPAPLLRREIPSRLALKLTFSALTDAKTAWFERG